MKIPIRYFSIGLLTASIIILIFFLINDEPIQDTNALSVEELSDAIESKGFRVIDEDDFISFSLFLDDQNEKNIEEEEKQNKNGKKNNKEEDKDEDSKKEDADEANKDKDKNKEKDKEETKSVTISVEQGFVPQDIAKALKAENIIDNEAEFVKYMEDNGYSPYVQIGKFKVTSDMDLKQLAETLTTYPGN